MSGDIDRVLSRVERAMDKIADRVEKLDERLDTQGLMLARNTASLEEHMRRTELNEKAVSLLQVAIEAQKDELVKVQSNMRANSRAWALIAGAGGAIATIVGVVSAVWAMLH